MTDCPFKFICNNINYYDGCSNSSLTEAKLWCNEFLEFNKYIERKINEMIK